MSRTEPRGMKREYPEEMEMSHPGGMEKRTHPGRTETKTHPVGIETKTHSQGIKTKTHPRGKDKTLFSGMMDSPQEKIALIYAALLKPDFILLERFVMQWRNEMGLISTAIEFLNKALNSYMVGKKKSSEIIDELKAKVPLWLDNQQFIEIGVFHHKMNSQRLLDIMSTIMKRSSLTEDGEDGKILPKILKQDMDRLRFWMEEMHSQGSCLQECFENLKERTGLLKDWVDAKDHLSNLQQEGVIDCALIASYVADSQKQQVSIFKRPRLLQLEGNKEEDRTVPAAGKKRVIISEDCNNVRLIPLQITGRPSGFTSEERDICLDVESFLLVEDIFSTWTVKPMGRKISRKKLQWDADFNLLK